MSNMPARTLLVLGLVLAFAIGIVVRVYQIPTLSMSHPEMYTPGIRMPEGLSEPRQRLALKRIFTGTFSSDTHPPGFYVVMFFWTKIFGSGIWALRLPSVLFGLSAIALVVWLGHLTNQKAAGWLAAVLMALNGFHVIWSQISRMFALASFLGLLSTILLLHLTRENKSNRWLKAAYTGVTLLGLASHVFYWPLFLSQMVWTYWCALRAADRMSAVCGLQMTILLLGSPLLAFSAYQSDNVVATLSRDVWTVGREYLSFSFLLPLDGHVAMVEAPSFPLVRSPLQETFFLTGRIAACLIAVVCVLAGIRSRRQEEEVCLGASNGPGYKTWLAAAIFAAAVILVFVSFARAFAHPPNNSLRITEAMLVLPFLMAASGSLVNLRWTQLSGLCRRLWPSRWMDGKLALVYVQAFVPFALLSLLCIRRPVLNARGLMILTPYLLLCLAVGIVAVARERRLLQAFLVLMLGALHITSMVSYLPRSASPVNYRLLAQKLVAEVHPADIILIKRNWRDTPILYYLPEDRFHLAELSQASAVLSRPATDRVWVLQFYPPILRSPADSTLGDFQVETVLEIYGARAVLYSQRK